MMEAENERNHSTIMATSLTVLQEFRNRLYSLLGNGKAALFDLMDAIMSTLSASSFVSISMSPLFRRRWPSIHEALQDGRPPRQELMKEYLKYIDTSKVVMLGGDHTAWSRLHAPTLKERTYEHKAQALGGKAVTLGQGYSTLAWIPDMEGSWSLPLLHERITSAETPLCKAASQLAQVCAEIEMRVLFLGDSEYGCAPFVEQTAHLDCDKLLRLRPNRVLYHAPPPYPGYGRPAKHGAKFHLKQPQTWGKADAEIWLDDDKLGRLQVRQWQGLHFKQAPDHPFGVICLDRLDVPQAKSLWLIWLSPNNPDLAQVWQHYLRRFAIEHWYRFVRQRLHWTLPKLSTPEQIETWSDLMPALTWQLWLARDAVEDAPLPWQKKLTYLSPGRVAHGFIAVLARIGSPAPEPKPRGKSPGWPKRKKRNPRIRYPTVKKRYTKPKATA
jgi:hypothetical protein